MRSAMHTLRLVVLGVAILFGHMLREGAQAQNYETALVAGGCFWCVESDFSRVAGVHDVTVGYTGGTVENPTYRQVTSGGSGHLEAALITFDPAVISYDQILHLFFRSVDPLDAGGQFCDRGAHYTTAIFVSDPGQRASAEAAARQASADLGQTVVTPIRDAATFWPAEDYHQGYHRSSDIIITRFGPQRKSVAYKLYRQSCGRDARVRDLWGDAAPFTGG